MPEVENKKKNLVKNRSPQGHFEGQDTVPLTSCDLFTVRSYKFYQFQYAIISKSSTQSSLKVLNCSQHEAISCRYRPIQECLDPAKPGSSQARLGQIPILNVRDQVSASCPPKCPVEWRCHGV